MIRTLDRTVIGCALLRLSPAARERAGRAALMRAAGFEDVEIARRLCVTTRTLRSDREAVRIAIVESLQEEGYSAREAARVLHLPTSAIHFRFGRQSGENHTDPEPRKAVAP